MSENTNENKPIKPILADPETLEVPENTGEKKVETKEIKEVVRNEKGQIVGGNLNPNGRPLGSKNFDTYFRDALVKLGKSNNKADEEVLLSLIEKGIEQANKGHFKYYKDIMDRLFGRAVQPMDLTTLGKELNSQQTIIFRDYGDKSN